MATTVTRRDGTTFIITADTARAEYFYAAQTLAAWSENEKNENGVVTRQNNTRTENPTAITVKRRGGRPKGSKNKN